MKALVGLLVAVAVLLVGALPAVALVLDDSPAVHHRYGDLDRHGPGPWTMRDRDGDERARGPMPPRVERCLRAAPDLEGGAGVRPGAPDDSLPGDIPQWRDKSMRAFAHCLALLHRDGPGGPGPAD